MTGRRASSLLKVSPSEYVDIKNQAKNQNDRNCTIINCIISYTCTEYKQLSFKNILVNPHELGTLMN